MRTSCGAQAPPNVDGRRWNCSVRLSVPLRIPFEETISGGITKAGLGAAQVSVGLVGCGVP